MKLYLLTQNDNLFRDTYYACVVAAESEEAARLIHPAGAPYENGVWVTEYFDVVPNIQRTDWATSPGAVHVEYLGEAAEGTIDGVVLASFNGS